MLGAGAMCHVVVEGLIHEASAVLFKTFGQ